MKELRASLSGEARRPGDLLGLEGEHLLREAHLRHLSLQTVYLRAGEEELLARNPWLWELGERQLAVLSHDVFDSAVSTATPQGIAATWIIRDPAPPAEQPGSALILEGVRDPGNLGTLIRSAAAFGMQRVFITPEAANHWNPKVVRSAAGAVFQTLVQRRSLDDIVAGLRGEGLRIFAAVSSFLSGPEDGDPSFAAPNGVLTGRIANADVPEGARHALPTHGKAAGRYDASFSYDTDFLEPCALLIGNEGAGLSPEARKLADEQVLIPCDVESLNAAVAGSILMYEVMRQGPLRLWARRNGLRP